MYIYIYIYTHIYIYIETDHSLPCTHATMPPCRQTHQPAPAPSRPATSQPPDPPASPSRPAALTPLPPRPPPPSATRGGECFLRELLVGAKSPKMGG